MTTTPIRKAGGELWIEGVSAQAVARRFGTPCYVYSRAAIEDAYETRGAGAFRVRRFARLLRG